MENEVLQQILNKLNNIEVNQQQMQSDINGLKSNQQQMQSDIKALNSKVDKIETDVNELKVNTTQGFENVDTKLDKLSSDIGHVISHDVGDAVDSILSSRYFKLVK